MMISLLNNYDDKSTGAKPNAPLMISLIDTFFGLHILVISTFKSTDSVSFSIKYYSLRGNP